MRNRNVGIRTGKGIPTFFLVVLFTALGISQTGESSVGDEEYAVASAALEHLWSGPYKEEFGSPLTILAHTSGGNDDGLLATLDRVAQPPDLGTSKKTPKPSDRRLVRQKEALAFKDALGDDTAVDWARKNADSYLLANKFHLSAAVVVPSEADWKELNHIKEARGLGEFYEAFRAKYRGTNAIIWISRVGFSRKRDQAVVEVGYTTGPEGGEGDFLLLAKRNGVWEVQHVVVSWMS